MKMDNSDLFCLLVSSLRYALGRSSYVVPQTAEIVLRWAPKLSSGQLDVLIRSVEMDIGDYREVTVIPYEDVWDKLLTDLKQVKANCLIEEGNWT
jgi:hypothetical protein